LDAFGGGVDFVDAEVRFADAIAQLLLAHGRFHNAQDYIGDFLGIAACRGQKRSHLGRNVIGDAVGVRAGLVGGGNHVAKDRSLVGAGFDDYGFDSLRGEFVAIGFGKRFHGEFAGGVKREGGDDDTAGAAADVHQQAFPVTAHVGKDGAIDADAAHEVRVHNLLGLLGGDGFGEADQGVTGVVDGDINAAGLCDRRADGKFHGGVAGDVAFESEDGKRFPAGQGEEIGGVLGIFALGIAHGGKDGVAVAREGLGEEPAEAGAGAGDEDYLLGIHGASLKPYGAPIANGSKECWKVGKRDLTQSSPRKRTEVAEKNAEWKALHRRGDGCSVQATGDTDPKFRHFDELCKEGICVC